MTTNIPTLAVLAGGMGTRLSRPKSGLLVQDQPILAWLAQRIQWPGQTLLVTAPANCHPAGAECWMHEITDPVDGQGPLQGVRSAITALDDQAMLLIPVDMLLVEKPQLDELVEHLAHQTDRLGVMCHRQMNNRTWIEPFPCILKSQAAADLENYWQAGNRSMRGLVEAGICGIFDANHWPARCWENLNTLEDMDRISRYYFPIR